MKDSLTIVFFDGVCNLCNSWVQWLIKRDRKSIVKFSSLQSAFALDFLKNAELKHVDSIVLFSKEKISIKSTAVLNLLVELGFPYNLSKVFFIVPRFIRDGIYDWVAAHRYKWYGKRSTCMMPDESIKGRFFE